jgi:folate-dependent phosphoribosylglycinamide formyltransferase PurN
MLNVAVLCSKRAPGLEALRERVRVACVLDRRPPLGCDRGEFDAETAEMLRPFAIDAVVLLGYLFIITEPLLAAFPDRIINIHDADLTLRNTGGGPRYPGLHATRDAIIAGERETRSSVHLVTRQLDAGPVIVRGDAFPVAPFIHEAVAHGENDIVRAYAYAQREWMMRSTWGALAAEGLAILSLGKPGTDKSVCATFAPDQSSPAARRFSIPATSGDQCGTDTLVCAPAGAAA